MKGKLGVILGSNHGPIPARRRFQPNIGAVGMVPSFVNQEAFEERFLRTPAHTNAMMTALTRFAGWPGSWRRRIAVGSPAGLRLIEDFVPEKVSHFRRVPVQA